MTHFYFLITIMTLLLSGGCLNRNFGETNKKISNKRSILFTNKHARQNDHRFAPSRIENKMSSKL